MVYDIEKMLFVDNKIDRVKEYIAGSDLLILFLYKNRILINLNMVFTNFYKKKLLKFKSW